MKRLVKRVKGAPGEPLARQNIPRKGFDPVTFKPLFGKARVRMLRKAPNDGQGDPVANITTTNGVIVGPSSRGATSRAKNPIVESNRGQRVVKPPNPAGGPIGRRLKQGQ